MSKHALLAPSSAHRWLCCHPSARLEEGIESGSVYAAEGSAAHALAEAILSANDKDAAKARASEFYSEEMEREVAKYVEYVRDVVRVARVHTAMFEVRVPLDFIERRASGTADAVVLDYKSGVLHVIDLKYGKGVEVSAYKNPQLMLYAYAATLAFDQKGLFGYSTIKVHVAQPRIDNWDVYEISKADLETWVRKVVEPAAKLAWEGKGDLVTGDHCFFCKVKGRCRQWALEAKEQAVRVEHAAALLTPAEVSESLSLLPSLKEWIKAIEEEAHKLMLNGESVVGFKLVESRGRRKIVDESALEAKLVAEGVDKESLYSKPEMLGITAIEAIVGKKVMASMPEEIVAYMPGKPTIVPDSDPRPAFSDCKFSPVSD